MMPLSLKNCCASSDSCGVSSTTASTVSSATAVSSVILVMAIPGFLESEAFQASDLLVQEPPLQRKELQVILEVPAVTVLVLG